MTNHDLLDKDHLPSLLDHAALYKALRVLETLNFRSEERHAYEDHLKWVRIEANTLKKYEAKGPEDGIEQGKAEG